MTLPVSVQIITLNEEAHIADCLQAVFANQPAEVIVIDGGSTDKTVSIASAFGARVLSPGRLGRGASRHLGYHSTEQPYVAMVDADDRPPPDWLANMVTAVEQGDYSALQSSLRAHNPHNFWSKGWDVYFKESIKPASQTNMVGHPSLYRTRDLLGARDDIGHEHEDTQLSVDFEARGLKQGVAEVATERVVPANAGESIAKWRGYGRGYRDFITRHPEKRKAIMKHLLWTIPIERGWRPALAGHWQQPLFATVMSVSITYGFLKPQRHENVGSHKTHGT
jgi:glycosyltransferase involved in cell wall biosynthesis